MVIGLPLVSVPEAAFVWRWTRFLSEPTAWDSTWLSFLEWHIRLKGPRTLQLKLQKKSLLSIHTTIFFHNCYDFSTIWYIDKDFHNNFFQFQGLTGFSVLLNKTQIWMQRLLNGSIPTTCTAFHHVIHPYNKIYAIHKYYNFVYL